MFLLSKEKRRAHRKQRYRENIARLCEVDTFPTASTIDGVVITVMMTQKPDPQRGAPITDGFLEYISPWWTTLQKVGLNGVILHDGLPEDFIASATTDQIKFCRCESGDLPILHQRHFAVRDYLASIDNQYVMVTDVSDVAFKRNPFEVIEQHSKDAKLFIGSETKSIGRNKCLTSELAKQFGKTMFENRPVVNPGILGGRREEVLKFFSALTTEIEQLKDGLLASDMSIINKVFHSNYDLSEIVTGLPLHSGFRKWEYGTSAAVMHK